MDDFKIELTMFVESEFPGMRYKIVDKDKQWFYIQACSFPFLDENDSEKFHYEFNWEYHEDAVLEIEIKNPVWKDLRDYLKCHIPADDDSPVECLNLHEDDRMDCCWRLKKSEYKTWKDGILTLRSIFDPVITEFIKKKIAGCLWDDSIIPLSCLIKKLPAEGEHGHWTGERGNSTFIFNKDWTPKNKWYNNPDEISIGKLAKYLDDDSPSVDYICGFPQFDRDGGTKDRKPLTVVFEEGIEPYLDPNEIIKKRGKNVDRENLHEEAFQRMAKKYESYFATKHDSKNESKNDSKNNIDILVDKLKTFKGDTDAAGRLQTKWGVSEDDVFELCHNPKKIHRVLHEYEDCKTVLLVPRLYHDHADHVGGIYEVSRRVIERHNKECKEKGKSEA